MYFEFLFSRVRILESGSLFISSARKEDQGRYQCQASNLAATRETRPVRIRVLGEYRNPAPFLF